MARYLSQHENVFFCTPKEPDYFARHLWFPHALPEMQAYRTRLDAYQALFEDADPARHLAVGEGSTVYLCSRQALEEIQAFRPDARIIVMLRDPVELAYSFHSEMLFHLLEDEQDFETAWRLQDARQKGESIPKGAKRLRTLLYGEVAMLGRQMTELLEIFPRTQVHWVFHEDLKTDPARAYAGVLAHLGVPDDGRDVFPKVNQNAVLQPTPMLRLLRQNRPMRRMSGTLKRAFGVRSWGIVERLQKQAGHVAERTEMPAALRDELRAFFRADIQVLADVTGRDLSDWL